jgi:hypothetical protein
MRGKPDLSKLGLPKKDVNAFLDGAGADQAEKPAAGDSKPDATVVATQPKEQKAFRLPVDLIVALRREAFERTEKTGTRVTETELVEDALRTYLKLPS